MSLGTVRKGGENPMNKLQKDFTQHDFKVSLRELPLQDIAKLIVKEFAVLEVQYLLELIQMELEYKLKRKEIKL